MGTTLKVRIKCLHVGFLFFVVVSISIHGQDQTFRASACDSTVVLLPLIGIHICNQLISHIQKFFFYFHQLFVSIEVERILVKVEARKFGQAFEMCLFSGIEGPWHFASIPNILLFLLPLIYSLFEIVLVHAISRQGRKFAWVPKLLQLVDYFLLFLFQG